MRFFILLLLILADVNAAIFYVSSNSTGGDGTIGNPWPLQLALSTNTIGAGDTVLMRAGTYNGPFLSTLTGSSENPVVVKSYPNERVIINDDTQATLQTTMSASTTSIDVDGSDYWIAGQVIIIGSEDMYISEKIGGTLEVSRGWNGTTASSHSIGAGVLLAGMILEIRGDHSQWQNFEVTSVRTARLTTEYKKGGGVNLSNGSTGNKLIDLIIYNTGHPGIGFWNQGNGGEINGCIMWGNGIYDNYGGGAWTRGSAIYAQNATGSVTVKDCIFFRNFTENISAFGTSASVSGFTFAQNIVMQSPNSTGISIFSEDVGTDTNYAYTNYFMLDAQEWGYTAISNVASRNVGNITVLPQNTQFIKRQNSGTWTNNTWFYDEDFNPTTGSEILQIEYPELASSGFSLDINYNTYYSRGSETALWAFISLNQNPGYLLEWDNGTNDWNGWTGYDSNSTFGEWPTNYHQVLAHRHDYNQNRWNLVVISTDGSTNATLDLSSIGFGAGSYMLRDAQNFLTTVSSGSYISGTINLPLTLTNVSEIVGTLTHYTNAHTNFRESGLFNVFVLDKISGRKLKARVTTP